MAHKTLIAGSFHPVDERSKIMITPKKALFAALATGAMMASAVAPAMAQVGPGHNRGWNGGNERQAINACSRIAERSAMRSGYGRANVTDIRDVRDTRRGFEVRGRINVRSQHGGRGWDDRGRNGYGNGYGNNHGRDSGSFNCRYERGRVVAFDIDGIRGL